MRRVSSFLAEVCWDLEWTLQQQGFKRTFQTSSKTVLGRNIQAADEFAQRDTGDSQGPDGGPID